MIAAMQMAQDAQAGNAYDDCTKRQLMAFNEVKECLKVIAFFVESLRQEPIRMPLVL